MAYRVDPHALERERSRLADGVRELEERWTETFWREVAPARGIAAPDAAKPARDVEAEVTRLAARLELLGALEHDAPRIVDEWETPPPLRPGPRVQWVGSKALLPPWVLRPFERALEQAGEAVERAAGELPIGVRGRVHSSRYGTFLVIRLVTTVAPGAGELLVRHERLMDDVRKLFGSKHDIQIGSERFDGVFAVVGDEPTARALLDADVRAALLRMGERGKVELRIARGRAHVGEYGAEKDHVDAGWLRDALLVARAVHAAPARPLRA